MHTCISALENKKKRERDRKRDKKGWKSSLKDIAEATASGLVVSLLCLAGCFLLVALFISQSLSLALLFFLSLVRAFMNNTNVRVSSCAAPTEMCVRYYTKRERERKVAIPL